MTSSSSLSASSSFPQSSTSSAVLAARKSIRLGQALTLLAFVALAAHYVRAIQYTPIEATQGLAHPLWSVAGVKDFLRARWNLELPESTVLR